MASFTPTTTAFTTSSTVATQQINQTVADPYWANVVLLMHFDGPNGSTQFIDSSSFANTISNQSTSYPAQISSTQSKFGGGALGGASAVSSYYTNVATSPCFSFGTRDFTIEFWYYWNGTYATTSGTQQALICNTTASITTNNWYIWFSNTAGNGTACMQFYVNAVAGYACTTPITTGWTHYAFTRTNGNIYAFYNGQLQSTTTITSTQGIDAGSPTSYPIIIGGIPGSSYYQNGWIDELRITNGICRYSSTFTPLTQPYPSVNVGYVQDPNLSQVSLLLHFDNGVTDASQNALAVNTAGSAVISAGNSTTSTGSSVYFPPSTTTSTASTASTAYTSSTAYTTPTNPYINASYSALSYTASNLALTSFNPLDTISAGANALFSFNKLTSSYTGPVANLAIQFKNSSNADIYADKYGNLTLIDTSLGASSNVSITNNDPFFTNVALLVHGTAITDSSKNTATLTATGVTTSSSVTKTNSSSLYYSTTANINVITPTSSVYTLGTQNFTIECWVYLTVVSYGLTQATILANSTSSFAANGWLLYYNQSAGFSFYPNNNGSVNVTNTVTANTWYHLAGVRNGNTFTFYINGISNASVTSTAASDNSSTNYINIGGAITSVTNSMQGYIQDVRITIGVARYTANFPVPVMPFPNFNFGTLTYTGSLYPLVNTLYDQSGNANHAYQISPYIQATLDPYNKLIDFRANYGSPYMQMPPGTIPANTVGNTVTFKSGTMTYAQQNLVAYYDFTKVSSYAGYGATTVTDLSGNNLNLTWNTAPTYTTTGYGGITLPASTYGQVAYTQTFSTTGFTFESLYAMTTVYSSGAASLLSVTNNGSPSWNSTFLAYAAGWFITNNSNGTNLNTSVVTNPAAIVNTYYHVVYTVTSGGAYSIYINGTLISSGTGFLFPASVTPSYLVIGTYLNSAGYGQPANVALARIYNTALTSSQVWANYCSAYSTGKFKAKFPSYVTAGLVGYWDFSTYASYPGSGTTLYDLSGNNYNATITVGTSGTGYNATGALSYNTVTTTVFTNTSFYPINFSSGMSIEVLVYFTVNNQNFLYISLTPTYTIQLYISSTQTIFVQPINNGTTLSGIQTYSGYSLNMWLHITITSTSSTSVIYINGIAVAPASGSGVLSGLSSSATTAGTIYLANYSSGSNGFVGKYAMTRIYNTALTATQVSQNYAAVYNKLSGNPYGLPPPGQAALSWPAGSLSSSTLVTGTTYQYNVTGQSYGNGLYITKSSSSMASNYPYAALGPTYGFWSSATSTYASGGSGTGTQQLCITGSTTGNLGGKIGEWVSVQLPIPILLTSYKFHIGGNGIYAWWILGSNDSVNWYTVDDRSSGSSFVYHDADSPTFNVTTSTAYSIYAIVVNSIYAYNSYAQLSLSTLLYYGIPQTPLALYNMPFPLPNAPYITTNLAGYWDFGLSASYPGSGSIVYDLSGNGYNLTYYSKPTYNSTGAISISQTSNYASSATVSVSASNFTLEILVYFTSLANSPRIFSYWTSGTYIYLNLTTAGQIYISGSGYYYTTNNVISINTWYHIIVTNSSTIYLNGSSVLTTLGGAWASLPSSGQIFIGDFGTSSGSAPTSNSLSGSVAFARFYSSTLTSAQVAVNYQNAINRIAGNPYNLPITTVATYAATTVPYTTTSLLAYWDFNKPASYAGYGATTVTDIQNTLPLTWSTAPTFNNNGYSSVTAASGYYAASSAVTYNLSTGFTFEVLIQFSAITGTQTMLCYSLASGATTAINFNQSAGQITLQCAGSTGTGSIQSSSTAIVAGQWYHIVGVYYSATASADFIYINGTPITLSTTTNFTNLPTSSALQFCISNFANNYINGNYALARVYTTPLSAAQVWTNYGSAYNSGRFQVKTPSYVTTGLVGYWDFSTYASYPNGGSSVYDLSGNGYTLTFAGGMVASNFINTGAIAMNANATSIAYASTLTSVTTANGFTFEFLVKPTLGTLMVMGSLYSGIICGIAATNGQVFVINQGSTSYSQTTGGYFVSYGLWNHIVISMPSSGIATSFVFYVNNVVATNQGSALANFTFPSSGTFNLGNTTSTSTTGGLNGQIAMMRFYNTTFTATQVSQNYAAVFNKLSGNPYGLPPPGQCGLVFPPTSLSSNNTILTGQPYGNGSYIVTASNSPGYTAYYGTGGWTGATGTYSTSSPYACSSGKTLGGVSGEWIVIQLPIPIILSVYSFLNNTTPITVYPAVWSIMGSNDGITWTVIDGNRTPQTGTFTQNQTGIFSVSSTTAYLYIGMVVSNIQGNGGYWNQAAIKYYGTPASLVSLYNMPYYTSGAPYITTNLVGYWDFGISASYPGSGVNIYDLSGNGYNMTLTNGQGFNSTGAISESWTTTTYASVPYTAGFTTAFTIELLFYLTNVSTNQWLFDTGNYGTAGIFSCLISGSQIQMYVGTALTAITNSISANTWYHFMVTVTSSGPAFYINGVLQTLITNPSLSSSFPLTSGTILTLGNWGNSGSFTYGFLSGSKVAFARIYNSALTAAQVSTNYQNAINKLSNNPYALPGLAYPSAALSSNTTTISGQVYGNGVYFTIGSSYDNATTDAAWCAFNRITGTAFNSQIWGANGPSYTSSSPYNYTGNTYFTTISGVGSIGGEWLDITLPNFIILKSYSLQARTDAYPGQMPGGYYIVGSPDNGITWVNLNQQTGLVWSSSQVQTFTVTTATAYNRYRIVITNINSATGNNYFTSIGEWMLYGNPLPSVYHPPSGFSSTSPLNYGGITYTISSSTYNSGNPAWNCVDYSTSSGWFSNRNDYNTSTGIFALSGAPYATVASGTTYTGDWVQLQLSTAISITSYYILGGGVSPYTTNPKNFVLLASNDGSTWTLIDTQSNISWSVISYTFTISPALTVAYTYYRILITVATADTYGCASLNEFRLLV